MQYKTILFDMDGTVTDSAPGIVNSIMYALEKFHITVEDRSLLYKFVGPPIKDSLKKYYNFPDEDCTRAVTYFREYFVKKGMYENEVYDGMEQVLERIKNSGRRTILATSKPEEHAIQIAKYFRIDQYFDFIAGATMDSSRIKKADVITYALESCGIDDLSSAVMVGDREYDIFGAKETGLDSIGVLYGYGGREELERAGADYIAESVGDILNYI